jgi:1-acyl-sn-glycerol-3-phosphate acyltransferase
MGTAKDQEWAAAVHRTRRARIAYGLTRRIVRSLLVPWLRVQHRGIEKLGTPGPVIVAPVHRSNLDGPLVASLTPRRIRALGKHSLFRNPVAAWVMAALGTIPVHRGEADREAMRVARDIVGGGELMIVFPEGTRQSGRTVDGMFDGVAYLASKTGAHIIPVGLAGTEQAMGSGSRGIRRVRCAVVVGDPIPAPEGRLSRPALTAFSERVRADLQQAFDEANALLDD